MQENLRVFHHDDAGDAALLADIGLQKGKHVDTPHAFAHKPHRLNAAPLPVMGRHLNGEHLVRVTV